MEETVRHGAAHDLSIERYCRLRGGHERAWAVEPDAPIAFCRRGDGTARRATVFRRSRSTPTCTSRPPAPREHPHGVFPVPWCGVLERVVQPHINLVRFQRLELDVDQMVPLRRSRVEIFVTRDQAEPVCEVIPDAGQRL